MVGRPTSSSPTLKWLFDMGILPKWCRISIKGENNPVSTSQDGILPSNDNHSRPDTPPSISAPTLESSQVDNQVQDSKQVHLNDRSPKPVMIYLSDTQRYLVPKETIGHNELVVADHLFLHSGRSYKVTILYFEDTTTLTHFYFF